MTATPITDPKSLAVQPEQLCGFDPKRFRATFHGEDKGFFAWLIVRYCKYSGERTWGPIDAEKFFKWGEGRDLSEILDRFIDWGYAVKEGDGRLRLTEEFVNECSALLE